MPRATASSVQLEVGMDGSTRPMGRLEPICDHTACFDAALRERADASRTVIMAVTNAGFASFWHNLRCSLERVGVARHALIVGTDDEACTAALAPGVACLVGERLFWPEAAAAELQGGAVSHGTAPYARLMHVKARPTLEAIRRGYNVLTTDTDIVFFRDPLAHLRGMLADADGGSDGDEGPHVLIQSDHDEVNEGACSEHHECPRSHWCEAGRCADEVCGGFHWMRGGAAEPQALLEGMFGLFEQQRSKGTRPAPHRPAPRAGQRGCGCGVAACVACAVAHTHGHARPSFSLHSCSPSARVAGDHRTGEQPALNYAIRRVAGLRFRTLPRALYPNGAAYFDRGIRPADGQLPYIVHNNWISGLSAKRARFERHAMWLALGGAGGGEGAGVEPARPGACVATALHASAASV